MTRTRTLIIIGAFMLCLAVMAALEFRTEDPVLSEGQMVTGSVTKEISSEIPPEMPALLDTQPAPVPTESLQAAAKSGVLVPLDNGTLRGSSGTTLDMTTQPESPEVPALPVESAPVQEETPPAERAAPPVIPTVATSPQPREEKAIPVKEEKVVAEQKKPEPVKSEPVKPEPVKPEVKPIKTPTPVEKADAPLVLTAKAPEKLTGNQKAITQTRLELGKDISFRMTAAVPVSVKTLLLEDPYRYVVDLQGEWGIQLPRIPKNLLLKDIRVGQRDGATRLVFELTRKPESAQVNKVNTKTVDVRIR